MKPCVLLRSSWQVVNIGDIAHTPGVLAILEKHLPNAEVILWASDDITPEVMAMEHRRFPSLKIVKGRIGDNGHASNEDLAHAVSRSDFLLHGSGPSFVAFKDVDAFVRTTGKPFGVFGITYDGNREQAPLLSKARFVYFRDSVSLEKAQKAGVNAPVMAFGPDGAFATDLRDDEKALAFMKENDLEEKRFLCCIGRLRYTPYWKIREGSPFNEERHVFNESWKERDHESLRKAITEVVRRTGMKILICPEDQTQMAVGKEMIYDKLPPDVVSHVVWRENFWLTDEALSVYIRSAGLFGNEMHSPIMCIGNGIPAIVCRSEEQTTKGYMWRDIGLDEWLFHIDGPQGTSGLTEAVLELAEDPEGAREKALKAREVVNAHFQRMAGELAASLSGIQKGSSPSPL